MYIKGHTIVWGWLFRSLWMHSCFSYFLALAKYFTSKQILPYQNKTRTSVNINCLLSDSLLDSIRHLTIVLPNRTETMFFTHRKFIFTLHWYWKLHKNTIEVNVDLSIRKTHFIYSCFEQLAQLCRFQRPLNVTLDGQSLSRTFLLIIVGSNYCYSASFQTPVIISYMERETNILGSCYMIANF